MTAQEKKGTAKVLFVTKGGRIAYSVRDLLVSAEYKRQAKAMARVLTNQGET